MSDIRLNLVEVDFALDAETREARHELLASFLGAYADGELPAETGSQIDAHLVGCTRCRRELELHRAVRERLGKEPVPAANSALRDRITAGIRLAPPPVVAAPVSVPATIPSRFGKPWQRWAVALVAIALPAVLWPVMNRARSANREAAASVTLPAGATTRLFSLVLTDYRKVTASDLPGRARDLASVRAAVPFAFTPLANSSLRLIAAWTTSFDDEPAAVLAYRWNDRVVLQYFVTEGLLFRSPNVRASLARKRDVVLTDGAQGLLLWAEPEYGSILVGDVLPSEFAVLRSGGEGR